MSRVRTIIALVVVLVTALVIASRGAPAAAEQADAPAGQARRHAGAITAGDFHACALVGDGQVVCWGYNAYGQLGIGSTDSRGDAPGEVAALGPIALGAGRRATALTSGSRHTCALLEDGAVKCWGYNTGGLLGLGDELNRGDQPGEMGDALPTVDLGVGRTATMIAAGSNHTCALLDDGHVKCWGANGDGQLGLGDANDRGEQPGQMGDALPAVDIGSGRSVTAISAGNYSTCAVLDDGSAKCWGYNGFGQLGLGDVGSRGDQPGEMGDALPAVNVGAGRTVSTIAVGAYHACALLDDATVKCWGNSDYGQGGLGSMVARGDQPGEMGDALPPVPFGPGRSVSMLVAGDLHNCALLDDGSLKCWGRNLFGQLGLGDIATRGDQPGEMGGALPVVALGAGRDIVALTAANAGACAVLGAGALKCWGRNMYGQLGVGDAADRGDQPGEMGDVLPVVPLLGPVSPPVVAPPGPPSVPGPPAPVGDEVVPLVPARLLDTRSGASTIDGAHAGTGAAIAGSLTRVVVAGRGGVPTDAAAAVLNVTAVGPAAAGFATVFPCDSSRPDASNLNYQAGQDIPNAVVAKLAADGSVCVFTAADTHLLIDVGAFVPATSPLVPLVPARLLDTRSGGSTIDATGAGAGIAGAGSVARVVVAGRGGVPIDAAAAVLNVTAVGPTAAGFATVFPCDAAQPNASNLNYHAGEDIPNAVVAKLAADGSVCVFTSAATNLLVDVSGSVAARAATTIVAPLRLLDTRPGGSTIDAAQAGEGVAAAGSITRVQIAGRATVPAGATTAVLNVTAVGPSAAGFATVFPCDAAQPNASNLNFQAGQDIPNAVVAKLAADGSVCVFTSVATHLLVDASGYRAR